jgi:hypothetical protein
MNDIRNRIIIGAVLALGMTVTATAADNPFIGTWKLNIAKSTATSSDPWPRSEIRVLTESDQGISETTRYTAADGKQSTTVHPPVKWDGLPHAFGADPAAGTMSTKWLGKRTIEWTLAKAGQIAASGNVVVSNDGKTLTVTERLMTPNVEPYDSIVFDRMPGKK